MPQALHFSRKLFRTAKGPIPEDDFPRPGEGFSSTGNFAVLPETASSSPSPSVTARSPFCRVSDIFPRSGEVCQRERLWRNHPLCAFIRKFTAMPRALPLGELPSEARLRGLALPPLRRHFHRKQARHPPLAVQAPSVKMQCRTARRPSGIALIKIKIPLFMASAKRRPFKIVSCSPSRTNRRRSGTASTGSRSCCQA